MAATTFPMTIRRVRRTSGVESGRERWKSPKMVSDMQQSRGHQDDAREKRRKMKISIRAVMRWQAHSTKVKGQTAPRVRQIQRPREPRIALAGSPTRERHGFGWTCVTAPKDGHHHGKQAKGGKDKGDRATGRDAAEDALNEDGIKDERDGEGNDIEDAEATQAKPERGERTQEECGTDLDGYLAGSSSPGAGGIVGVPRPEAVMEEHARHGEEEAQNQRRVRVSWNRR